MFNIANPFTQVLLPLVVMVVMFALGTTLTLADLKRVLRQPQALIMGLLAHTLLLPALAVGVAILLQLPPPMAVGLVLIAACPANAAVNLFTFLARGDTMLSVSLTACASMLSVLTVPLFMNLALQLFQGGDTAVRFPLLPAALGLFLVTTLPVMGGMLLRQKRPRFARELESRMARFGAILIVLIVAGAIWSAQSDIIQALVRMGAPVLILNVFSMATAWSLAILMRLPKEQCLAVGFENGLQNFGLAAFVALSLMQDAELLVPAVAYGLTMWISAIGVLLLARLKQPRTSAEQP